MLNNSPECGRKSSARFRIRSVKLDWMKQGSCVSTILWLLAEPAAPDGLSMLVQGHPLVWKVLVCTASVLARQTTQCCSVLASHEQPSPVPKDEAKAPQVGSGIMIGDMGR